MERKGIIYVSILVLIVAVVILFLIPKLGYNIACTRDAKICPDGSIVARTGLNCEFEKCPSEAGAVYCNDFPVDSEYCITLYQPVCGWNDPSKIQCVTYPCAKTYSNSCFACLDSNILYYTEGECPGA